MTGGFDTAGRYHPEQDPTLQPDPGDALTTLVQHKALTFTRDLMSEDLRALQADAPTGDVGASISKALQYALFTGATKYLQRRIKDIDEKLQAM